MKKYTFLIDTSSRYLSLGIALNKKLISFYNEECFKRQSEEAIPQIINLFKKNSISFDDIKDIVVGVGPGSFTGVRIGITIAKIMAYTLKIKIYGVSSLKSQINSEENGFAILDARAGRSYVCAIKNKKVIIKESIMKNEEVLKLIDKEKIPLFGETEHLNIKEKKLSNILEGMLAQKHFKKNSDDVNKIDALYLKGTNEYKKV